MSTFTSLRPTIPFSMRKTRCIFALMIACASTQLAGQNPFPSGSPLTQPPDRTLLAPPAQPHKISYGTKSWQKVELFPIKQDRPAPLVVVLGDDVRRGGDAISWLRFRLNQSGIAMAVVPDRAAASPRVPQAIGNYLAALEHLKREADHLQIDVDRVVLIGFGRGGSIATLFGTDPKLLSRAGIPLDNLRGVISIGGVDFDIKSRMARSAYLRSVYRRQFSTLDAELAQLSPFAHVALPNASAFVLSAFANDEDALAESRAMTGALKVAGTDATFVHLPEPREGRRKSYLFVEEEGSGRDIMDFVRTRLSRQGPLHP